MSELTFDIPLVTLQNPVQSAARGAETIEELDSLIERVKRAQATFATYTQEQVDRIFRAASIAASAERISLAKDAVQETGMGVVEDKVIKNHFAAEYIYNKYRDTQTCGVLEEECDGENLKHLFQEARLCPDYVVICEPSSNRIALGHKGKAQVIIKTRGLSAHGSAPEKGVNAVYEMAEIIQRVEKTNARLMKKSGLKPTLVLTRISSTGASINAVPSECEIYLDRRMVPGETEDTIRREMDQLIRGKNAAWQVGTLHAKSWTGLEVEYEPVHPAWRIDLAHELTLACKAAYLEEFGAEPAEYDFWDFSTNAVTPVSLGIPTIGFGPGESKLAHMRDESIEVDQIIEACGFYTRLIRSI